MNYVCTFYASIKRGRWFGIVEVHWELSRKGNEITWNLFFLHLRVVVDCGVIFSLEQPASHSCQIKRIYIRGNTVAVFLFFSYCRYIQMLKWAVGQRIPSSASSSCSDITPSVACCSSTFRQNAFRLQSAANRSAIRTAYVRNLKTANKENRKKCRRSSVSSIFSFSSYCFTNSRWTGARHRILNSYTLLFIVVYIFDILLAKLKFRFPMLIIRS